MRLIKNSPGKTGIRFPPSIENYIVVTSPLVFCKKKKKKNNEINKGEKVGKRRCGKKGRRHVTELRQNDAKKIGAKINKIK